MVMGLHLKRVEKPVLQSDSESWRECVYKIALHHLATCLGKKCAQGKYVLFAQKVGMLSLYFQK